MFLHNYLNECTEEKQYEEFNKAISSTGQILLKTLKRVVIRGKRGRGVITMSLKITNTYLPKQILNIL